MKINLILAAAIFAATFGAAVCPAQTVGNYRAASKTDEAIVRAANFAVAARNKARKNAPLKLIGVERAEKQIVAGANYRLCVTVKANGGSEQATTIVYKNPQNQYELTEWASGNCAGGETSNESNATDRLETETYKGSLQIGKTETVIVYVGEESGDFAAFCFANDSKVGRAILSACKKGKQCEVVGENDGSTACKVPGLNADLSASGKITKVVSVKSLGRRKR